MIAGRDRMKVQAALAQSRASGGTADFLEVDVTKEASCKRAVGRAAGIGGRLDILVNNAGTILRKPPQDGGYPAPI